MTDDELETLLRHLRPAGPPPELRRRVLLQSRRTWPWACVAAALLAITLAGERVQPLLPAPVDRSRDGAAPVTAGALESDDGARLRQDLERARLELVRRQAPPVEAFP